MTVMLGSYKGFSSARPAIKPCGVWCYGVFGNFWPSRIFLLGQTQVSVNKGFSLAVVAAGLDKSIQIEKDPPAGKFEGVAKKWASFTRSAAKTL